MFSLEDEMGKILSYSIIAEEYERLLSVDRKFKELTLIIEKNIPSFITVAMIGKAHGLTRQEVANRPWMMPNCGLMPADYDGPANRKRFWRYDEYLDWISIPEEVRIRQYRESSGKRSG